MPGKRVQFEDETWQAIALLSRDSMKDFQELADAAFADLLKKHRRPVGLKDELRQSLRQAAANDAPSRHAARPATRRPAKRTPLRPGAARRN
ncbi:hypothetical protein J2S22_004963 [Rhodoplanes tepidamans]|uniref:CopG family transcriptional regulator n=2 Tax=Rhodoplanes TaxID=29407 RepID=A0ABT5JD20_RHOTP|nr:hypothetical protein [Rhodoplanes tepidamans]MDC7787585.1 hypothetical protein [Rhodoplanes tepidamans]MDQ0358013.1 hypothetical protein [Rhodoplanes tepidamans]